MQTATAKREKNPQPKANSPSSKSLWRQRKLSMRFFFHYGCDQSETGASPRPCIYIAVCVYICVCVCPCICAIQPYGSIYSHAKGLTADRGPGLGNILAITALLLRCCSLHRPSTPPRLPLLSGSNLNMEVAGFLFAGVSLPPAALFPLPPAPSALNPWPPTSPAPAG